MKAKLTAPKKNAENDKKFILDVHKELRDLYKHIYVRSNDRQVKYQASLNCIKSGMSYINLADVNDSDR